MLLNPVHQTQSNLSMSEKKVTDCDITLGQMYVKFQKQIPNSLIESTTSMVIWPPPHIGWYQITRSCHSRM